MSDDLTEICERATHDPRRLPQFGRTHRYYRSTEGFIYFISRKLPKTKQLQPWKFHISIHQEDFDRVWPLIYDILLDLNTGASAFKVIDLQFCTNRGYIRQGKQIVIYTFKNECNELIEDPGDLFNLLKKIEEKLRKAYIRGGQTTPADCKIPGSRYFSMRCDLYPDSKNYLSIDEALEINPQCPHNPFSQPNPYQLFSMCSMQYRLFSTQGRGFYRENIKPKTQCVGIVSSAHIP